MGVYVDGFVTPVKKERVAEYRRLARKLGKIWIELGALAVQENIADDVKPGKWTSFPQAVQLQDDEVVAFSWIVYRNRRDRDRINQQIWADPRVLAMDPKSMPIDGKRMFWGGFKELVKLG